MDKDIQYYGGKLVNAKELLGEKFLGEQLELIGNSRDKSDRAVREDDIQVYLFNRCNRTSPFYDELRECEDERDLFLVYAKKYHYVYSNSNKFFLTMYLLQGISMETIEKEPILLQDYLQKVRAYINHELLW